MKRIDTDVLVVGTGFGAAPPALRMARAGWRVTLVEKGPHLDVPGDFRQTQDPKYLMRYLKGLSDDHLNLTYAEALGGGSGFYEMVSLRAPSLAFDQVDARGVPLWPAGVDRRSLDPFYELAEALLHVRQIRPDDVPKTGLVFALLMKRLGYSCERARYAVRGCLGSSFCVTGCIYGAKQSLHMNYLPAARAAGATVETDLEARAVRPTGDPVRPVRPGAPGGTPYRYEVACRSRTDPRDRRIYRARIVVLAGGAVGSAAVLLRSRRHLPGLSRHVGRGLAFNGSVKVAGLLPSELPDGDMFTGRSHPGMISYEFLRSHGVVVTAGKALPVLAVAAGRLRLDGDPREPAWWGEAHVDLMRQYRHRVLALVAFGLTAPAARLELEGGEPRVRLDPTPELVRYHDATRALLASILTRNGCRLVEMEAVSRQGEPRGRPFFSSAHLTGSCRMADGPDRGVVDPSGQVFGHPGLYVSDGAAIPSSLAVNTSLTILANAERIAAGMVERHAGREAAAALRRETAGEIARARAAAAEEDAARADGAPRAAREPSDAVEAASGAGA